MYNKNIKEEYLEIVASSSKDYISKLLNRIDIYENNIGKDLFDFTEEEIIEMFTSMNSCSVQSLESYASIFRNYTQWAVANNMNCDGINHYDMISKDQLRNCVNIAMNNQKYIDYEKFKEVIIYSDLNIRQKAAAICCFYGFNVEEMCKTTIGNFDYETHTITTNTGKKILVDDYLFDILVESCNTYEYEYEIFSFGMKRQRITKYNTKGIVKSKNAELKPGNLASILAASKSKVELISFDKSKLNMSGFIYHCSKIAHQKGYTDHHDLFVDEDIKRILAQYEFADSIIRKIEIREMILK